MTVAAQVTRQQEDVVHHRLVRRFSARGMQALKRGLQTAAGLSAEMGIPLASLVNAPKAEWHHDLTTGERVWLYDREAVWRYVCRGRSLKLPRNDARSLRNNQNRQDVASAPNEKDQV